jgi:hypothetical protein
MAWQLRTHWPEAAWRGFKLSRLFAAGVRHQTIDNGSDSTHQFLLRSKNYYEERARFFTD